LLNKFYLLTLSVFLLDHLTKWIVRSNMGLHDAFDVIPGCIRISYVQNTGIAFGFFADIQSPWKPYILALMAIVAIVVIALYSARMPSDRLLLQIALAATMGGILGNFADRIMNGFVVDFVEFHLRDQFHWPTFNLADSAITVGIALLLIDTIKNPDKEEEPEKPTCRIAG